ncbi:hypothetical protein GUJ93_ZPchr0009g2217 [Zizania palustris]|uniref:Uncharacterized protein n=1 Tax=Zizania palustris TaxID=103762 RepID=A0A8J5R1M1_ZIZPA|nr:hypothetical protein GUJ93_ZPchr0009g2217 [Zizania palustris]
MKHSMSTSSQCLSPSTLLDEPHPDHAFDAPRLLRPSSGTFECLPPEHTSNSLPPQRTCSTILRSHSIRSTFEVPHLRGLCLGAPSARATLRTLCLHLARLDPRTDPDHLRSHRDGAPRSPGIKPPARPRFTCCEPCPSPPKSLRTTDKQTSVSSTPETSPVYVMTIVVMALSYRRYSIAISSWRKSAIHHRPPYRPSVCGGRHRCVPPLWRGVALVADVAPTIRRRGGGTAGAWQERGEGSTGHIGRGEGAARPRRGRGEAAARAW